MELNRDFREFLQSFVSREVRFLIIGGYALAAHGHPRYTKDLDVWVWADPSNSPRVLAALGDFGFGALDLTAADFEQSEFVVQLGREPQRIDLLTFATGVDFSDAYERRVLIDVGGFEAPFISIADLRANKRATGRLRDLADLEDLPPADDHT